MSRQLRLEDPGSLWHITMRGNEKRDIYRDDNDRVRFLELLAQTVQKNGWILTAYVLMSNHVHLFLELTERTLSRGMQWLNGQYPKWFNWRHDRVGHLYQGRYKGILVEKETYFLNVLRYVVLNPVRAGMVERPEDYPWSSHRAVLGRVPAPEWLAVDDVLGHFSEYRDEARMLYSRFVDRGIGSSWCPWDELSGQMFLGSEPWLHDVRKKIERKPRSREHPRAQRRAGRPGMETIISALADSIPAPQHEIRNGRGGLPRMAAAWIGRNEGLLRNREIAEALRLRSASHVVELIRRCSEELQRNPALRDSVDRCLSTLRSETDERRCDPT